MIGDTEGKGRFVRDPDGRSSLRRCQGLANAVADGIVELDSGGEIVAVNDAFVALTGVRRAELLDRHVDTVLATKDGAEELLSVRSSEDGESTFDLGVEPADGEVVPCEVRAFPVRCDGEFEGAVGVFRPSVDRVRIERADGGQGFVRTGSTDDRDERLERLRRRYRTLVEHFPNGAVALVDEDLRYITFGGTLEGEADLTREDLEGALLREALPSEVAAVVVPRHEAALDGETSTVERTIDGRSYRFHFVPVRDGDGRIVAAMAISQEVTEREEYRHEIERRQRQQRAVADLGQLALETDDPGELMAEASCRVAEILEADYCKVLDLDREAGELSLRRGVGWREGIVGSATVAADERSQAGYTLQTEEPVVVEDLAEETRFSGPELLTSHDVTSGISTIVGSVDDPWGILGVHDTERRTFTEKDVGFVQAIANVLASAIGRIERERRLERQGERSAALNSLYEVVHGISDAAIEQSTREEIERIVCERLADAESYLFAWIGEADADTGRVTPVASAGTDGYLEGIEISIDPDDPHSGGPTGRAFLTGEVRTARNIEEPAYEPWREVAREHGVRSSAAIPIAHEEAVFGVLNVYADRPNAFASEEQEMLRQLGDIVGHAIAAVERKRAITSEEAVELDLRVRDVFDSYDVPETDGTISFDRAVPIDENEYRIYGTATGDVADTLAGLADEMDHWNAVSISKDATGTTSFEVESSRSSLIGTVAAHNGTVESVEIEGGDFNATARLPRDVDVRAVVEAIEENYPDIEILSRRQVERSNDARPLDRTLLEGLTDRQRTVLETAYYSGFYEWPRENAGKEIAERLDIAPATFSQHLRKAEGTVFDAIFEEVLMG